MEVRDPRLLKILSPKIERVAAVYDQGYAPGLTAYWQTRPYDERIAAVLSTVGVMTDMQLTLDFDRE